MFDYIKCEMDLPKYDKEMKNRKFQTKDLEQELYDYVITSHGTLKRITDYNRDGELYTINGIDIPFDGILEFYDSLIQNDSKSEFVEYLVKFKNNKVVEIVYKEKYKGYEEQFSDYIAPPKEPWQVPQELIDLVEEHGTIEGCRKFADIQEEKQKQWLRDNLQLLLNPLKVALDCQSIGRQLLKIESEEN